MLDEVAAPFPLALHRANILPPQRIVEQLDAWVIGQERAKRVLAVAVYNHYRRLAIGALPDDEALGKSNILLVGPTGCGKTLLAQALARILDVPFCIADATTLTQAGYVGEDVESILVRLIQAADGDVARAEQGIIYIDEIDKIARTGAHPSLNRDVSGEGVQQALLKILEGAVAHVPAHRGQLHTRPDVMQINTANILFICGGAFDSVVGNDTNRSGKHTAYGFALPGHTPAPPQGSLPDDFGGYGLIPELIGRLPVRVMLDPLGEEALLKILTEPRNALIAQYRTLFALDGVELVFTREALRVVARQALARGTGARGLRTIMEETLIDLMFELPSRADVRAVYVTDKAIRKEEPPILDILDERHADQDFADDDLVERRCAPSRLGRLCPRDKREMPLQTPTMSVK